MGFIRNMNWSDISSAVAKLSPFAGAALSGPVGMAIGVGGIIANLFGVEADPKKVIDYINGNPEKASERLQFEMANNLELQKLALAAVQEGNRHSEEVANIELQNVESARNNSANVNASPVDNQIKLTLVFGQIGILVLLILLFFIFKEKIDQSVSITIGTVAGAIMANLGSMINFYWGTSASSRQKDEVIAGKKI